MSKESVLAVLERAACENRFIGRLTDNFTKAVEDYNLTSEEGAALSSGDVRWIEAHIGKLDKRLRTWLDCRLGQERW